MSSSTAAVSHNGTHATAKYNFIQIFWVFVGAAFIISGIIAWYCMAKGGSVSWSTRFGVWVQVACKL